MKNLFVSANSIACCWNAALFLCSSRSLPCGPLFTTPGDHNDNTIIDSNKYSSGNLETKATKLLCATCTINIIVPLSIIYSSSCYDKSITRE